MNLDSKQAVTLVDRLHANITQPTAKVVLCPSFIYLPLVSEKIRGFDPRRWAVGAQNINEHDTGSFTGEVSAPMVRNLVKYSIVGHSERRINFGETDRQVALKVASCVRSRIIPILCIGEDLGQRNEGLARRAVLSQLEEGLSELTRKEMSKIVIAYEPIWAIGTGQSAQPGDISVMLEAIYKYLIARCGGDIAIKIPLLYGGSVNGGNAKYYLEIHSCSGLLVGGASLNYREFSKICQL